MNEKEKSQEFNPTLVEIELASIENNMILRIKMRPNVLPKSIKKYMYGFDDRFREYMRKTYTSKIIFDRLYTESPYEFYAICIVLDKDIAEKIYHDFIKLTGNTMRKTS